MADQDESSTKFSRVKIAYEDESDGLHLNDFEKFMQGATVTDFRYSTITGNLSLDFTGGRSIQVQRRKDGFGMLLTTKPEDFYSSPVPIVFKDFNDYRLATSAEILHSLNETYLLLLLINRGELDPLRQHLLTSQGVLSSYPVADDEQLEFISVSRGSWFGEMWTKSKEGVGALKTIGVAMSSKGRELIVRRAEADTKIQESNAAKAQAEAELKRLEVSDRLFEIYHKQIKSLNIDDPVRLKFEQEYLVLQDYSETKLIDVTPDR